MRSNGKDRRYNPSRGETERRHHKAQFKRMREEEPQRTAFQCAARGCDGCLVCEQE